MSYDEAARALETLLSEVYQLVGDADELKEHPLLTESEGELIGKAFRALEEAANQIHDRLEDARGRR